jgi:hypothetical protein
MKRALIAFFIGAAVIAALAFWPKEYRRVRSPDGRHLAIARYRAYQSWLPLFPGQAGDKKGWIVILTKDGMKIGEADVEMISEISDIRWAPDSVEIRLVATFKL